jgi:hypothetical protein
MRRATFASDMGIMAATLFGCLMPRLDPALLHRPPTLASAGPMIGPEDSSAAK